MKSYLITYDLMKPGQNYEKLYEAIKNVGPWCHLLESNWVVKSDLTAAQIRDKITPHIDKSDKLFVAQLSRDAAWIGLSEEISKWLKDNL
jgi:hypothetical protein